MRYKISSVENALVKHCVRLRQDPKLRETEKSVLIFGLQLIQEIQTVSTPKRLFGLSFEDTFKAQEVYEVTEAVLKKITGLVSMPFSKEALVAEFPLPEPTSIASYSAILVLDQLSDPGNVGTLLRTALALGFEGVFFVRGTVDPFHEKVLRASRGALFRLPYQIGSLEDLILLKNAGGFNCYVADIAGLTPQEVKNTSPLLLILSNEARGVSEEVRSLGKAVTIPMPGPMESLNVSIAGALLMYALIGSHG